MNIIDAMDDAALFGPWYSGSSWNGWRSILKGAFGLSMTPEEVTFFKAVTDRDPPTERVRELWIVGGRRGGKDSIASLLAAHAAGMFHGDRILRPGERASVMCMASDRDQAGIVLRYTKAMFAQVETLSKLVHREISDGLELANGVDIEVTTANAKAPRGKPVLLAIFDEVGRWQDENSSSPDRDVYDAVRPGTLTIPGAMIVGISTPHRRAGILWERFKRFYGKPGDVLVVLATSAQLNPTLEQREIDRDMEADPALARSEYYCEWRDDIAAYIAPEAIDRCVSLGVLERPRVQGVTYSAFCDPSGGVSDSMTLAISHCEFDKERDQDIAVLDLVREVKAPFSPDAAVAEFVTVLKSYGVRKIRGDRYAAEWVSTAFKKVGIEYTAADLAKSTIYQDALPRINSATVDLLDHPRLITQLLGLERRTARGGRDSIDHARGGKDDVANAVCGSLVYVSSARHNQKAGWGTALIYPTSHPFPLRLPEIADVEMTAEQVKHQAQLAIEAKSRRDEARAQFFQTKGLKQ